MKARIMQKIKKTEDEAHGVKLPMWKLISSMMIIILSGVVPVMFITFFFFAGFPKLEVFIPVTLFRNLIFTALLPFYFIAIYFTYIFTCAWTTKLFIMYYNTRCSPSEGKMQRQFKEKDHPDHKKVHYYHMRGAIVKYTLWTAQKSLFPDLVKYLLRHYGHNKVGRDVIYENAFLGLEFTTVKDNAVIEAGAAISAHVVDSIYGSIYIYPITIGENSVIGANNIIGPGTQLPDNSMIGDGSVTAWRWPLEKPEGDEGMFYMGTPTVPAEITDLFAQGSALKEEYLEKKSARSNRKH